MLSRKFFRCLFVLIVLVALPLISTADEPKDSGFASVDQIFGQTGKSVPGNVTRYAWPRSDLHVAVGGVAVETPLALGSWAAFQKTADTGAMAMGDLVLLESEVNPVISALQQGGLDVLAVHNHLMDETPRVLYVHYEGHGTPDALAKALKDALAKTKTPAPAPPKPAAALTPEEEKAFDTIGRLLGQKGSMAGKVLQIGVPRAESIEDHGMQIPPSMGMSIAMNFQFTAGKIYATGDFVLIADEVNPVIRELQAHAIQVTALHSHMLSESPRLFFMHFWAAGTAEDVAAGLKAALSKVNTKKQ